MGYRTEVYFQDVPLRQGITTKQFMTDFAKECEHNKVLKAYDGCITSENDCVSLVDEFKFYEPETVCEFLAKYVTESTIDCYGEDRDDCWKVEFDGKGNYKILQSRIFYGFDSYAEFMNEYQQYMDDKLKQELEQFIKDAKVVKGI